VKTESQGDPSLEFQNTGDKEKIFSASRIHLREQEPMWLQFSRPTLEVES
jgi:hypothetical protein